MDIFKKSGLYGNFRWFGKLSKKDKKTFTAWSTAQHTAWTTVQADAAVY